MALWTAALLVGAVVSQPDTACITMDTRNLPLDERLSPLDSVSIALAGGVVKVCYGRPSARGRTMIGGASVPYGRIWRTGANEPTMIHTTVPIAVAGVEVSPGTYSLYTLPGKEEWQVIVNRSITQWGLEGYYREDIRAQEAGRSEVAAEHPAEFVETLTMALEPAGPGAVTLVLTWEHTRIRIPIVAR